MKTYLMYRDRDFDIERMLPPHEKALTQDLELHTLFNAMACGDDFLLHVARKAVLLGETDVDTILYRQAVLRDCLNNSSVVRDIYDIAVDTLEKRRSGYWGFAIRYPGGVLSSSIDVLQMAVVRLQKLRHIANTYSCDFSSQGFNAFFATIKRELDDEFFAEVSDHLKLLKFRDGVPVSAELGDGDHGVNYILHRPRRPASWIRRIFATGSPTYTYRIADRDDAGARALSDLRDRGVSLVASALAQSTDHIINFFRMLRMELAFYVGCLNLHRQLILTGTPVSFPEPAALWERTLSFGELYDPCLALTMQRKVVGTDLPAKNAGLFIITGANQGGKSTFLRSVGLALLMMQCGMFVAANAFRSNVCDGLFTHYKRQEDVTMKSGKFDEELSRMSDIVDHITPNSVLLCGESFSATNEREGSEIARQIVSALLETGIKIFFVTHMYDFAHGFFIGSPRKVVLLRAERLVDGRRTFKLSEAEPLQTSYGPDLYERICGRDQTTEYSGCSEPRETREKSPLFSP